MHKYKGILTIFVIHGKNQPSNKKKKKIYALTVLGSFNTLNSTLNPFASSTTASAPPDAWAYSPAYDLTPHLNILSPSNSPYSASFGGPGNNGTAAAAAAYSYATMLPQHDASLFAAPTGNAMRVHQDYMNASNSPPPALGRADYQTMVTQHSPPNHMAPEDEHHTVSI